jgi:hypothetical protein
LKYSVIVERIVFLFLWGLFWFCFIEAKKSKANGIFGEKLIIIGKAGFIQ